MSDTPARAGAPPQTFAEVRRTLRPGDTPCEALVSAFLEKITAENERLKALRAVDGEGALGHARYLDDQQGSRRSLEGLVLAIEDVISVRGDALTCGSQMLEGFTALYDAAVVERLRTAGALFIGRAHCDEFGVRPTDAEHGPGGSSGGAAAAVAAGFCHAALAGDTGGSLRQAAARCGLVGLRPTYGRVPRHGLVAHASSLDTVGALAHSAEDAACLLNVIAGEDARDATSAPVEVPDFTAALGRAPETALDGLRVGLPKEYFAADPFDSALDDGVRTRVEEQAERLRAAGAEVVEVPLPHARYGLAAYHVLAAAEASSSLARYDGVRYGRRAAGGSAAEEGETADGEAGAAALERLQRRSRSEGFGEAVKRRILLGTYVLSAGARARYYERARRVRTLLKDDFDRVFDPDPGSDTAGVDLLLTPTTPVPAFRRGRRRTGDPARRYGSDLFTVGPSLAGLPALSVPVGAHPEEEALPVGAQLVGRAFDEALLLQVGEAMMALNEGAKA